ncbi:hypothetical protein NEUTE1DRAFT_123031 [Neurospora tetrasperma FGSC 2508]|uniref:Uncharacterized protein n=1 Tax=Neurospora tetrasperma (strain FGSC 2508 / ATCC MYA-4615 / P0657) TaxID=510951 RepID=F8MQ80_NEUT8|nr:uncharacterized protein NEUTE1DRAFT_123031 [Neurospora tetrasperma FGSC 2508]EGO56510.1 hypothetical protein NEUTE1DRAFT_123031 [Neurospora tetrasperma FGSC 2508]
MFLWRLPRNKRHVVVALRASQGLPALAGSTERDGQNKKAVLFATTGNSAVGVVAKHITLLVVTGDYSSSVSDFPPSSAVAAAATTEEGVQQHDTFAVGYQGNLPKLVCGRACLGIQRQVVVQLRGCCPGYRERNGKLGNCWGLEDYSWRFDMVFVLLVEHKRTVYTHIARRDDG